MKALPAEMLTNTDPNSAIDLDSGWDFVHQLRQLVPTKIHQLFEEPNQMTHSQPTSDPRCFSRNLGRPVFSLKQWLPERRKRSQPNFTKDVLIETWVGSSLKVPYYESILNTQMLHVWNIHLYFAIHLWWNVGKYSSPTCKIDIPSSQLNSLVRRWPVQVGQLSSIFVHWFHVQLHPHFSSRR